MNFLYFDPGLGAMIVQAVVAAAAGVLLFSRRVMYKIKGFLGILKEEDTTYDSIDIDKKDEIKKEWRKKTPEYIKLLGSVIGVIIGVTVKVLFKLEENKGYILIYALMAGGYYTANTLYKLNNKKPKR